MTQAGCCLTMTLADKIFTAVTEELNDEFGKRGLKVQACFIARPTLVGPLHTLELIGRPLDRERAKWATIEVLKRLQQNVGLLIAGVEAEFPVREVLEKGTKKERAALRRLIAEWRKGKRFKLLTANSR